MKPKAAIDERLRIGAELRALRKAKGLTVRALAEKVGIDHSNIVRIENGRYSVGIDVVAAVANALGASLEITT